MHPNSSHFPNIHITLCTDTGFPGQRLPRGPRYPYHVTKLGQMDKAHSLLDWIVAV